MSFSLLDKLHLVCDGAMLDDVRDAWRQLKVSNDNDTDTRLGNVL